MYCWYSLSYMLTIISMLPYKLFIKKYIYKNDRFPAYPHRVWALWWRGGKRRLRTSRCPCRGRLGTLKTPSCPWRWVPGSRSKFGNWTSVPSLYSWNIAECDVKPQSTTTTYKYDATSFCMAQPRVIFIHYLYLTKLNPVLRILGHSSVGRVLDRSSKDCWLEAAVRHYFSANNVRLLACVFTGGPHN